MPDSSVVCCVACGHHQVLVQLLPVLDNHFTCSKAECGKHQPACVVSRDGAPLRSYDVLAMRAHARELNACSQKHHASGSIIRQKTRVLDQVTR